MPLPSNSQSHHPLQMIGHTLWTLHHRLSCQMNHIHRTSSLLLRWVKEDHSQKRSSRGWHFSNIDTTEFICLLITLPTYQAAGFPSPLTNQLSLRSLVLPIPAAPQKWMKLPSSKKKKKEKKKTLKQLTHFKSTQTSKFMSLRNNASYVNLAKQSPSKVSYQHCLVSHTARVLILAFQGHDRELHLPLPVPIEYLPKLITIPSTWGTSYIKTTTAHPWYKNLWYLFFSLLACTMVTV